MSCFAILMGIATSMSTAVNVSSDHIGNVFTDREAVKLRVETTEDTRLSVIDYEGNKVFEQEVAAGESTVDIGMLKRSHYAVNIESGDSYSYFAVVPAMENRPDLKDSNIASDVAMSWLVKPEQFEDLAYLTRLSGVIWVRDRMRWGEVETTRGNWAERTRYDLSAEAQLKHGLKVYQVFHNTPDWAHEGGTSHSFPDDLRDAYNFAAGMARRFEGKVSAWEVWNEPDIIHFSEDLGDAYAAMLKAMYLGFKSVDPDLPVLLCSFAMEPRKFAETVFQNRVLDYFDIYNYHIYGKWEDHTGRALKHIEIMRRHGLERKPVWLTEAGHARRREPDLVELTEEQGREVAEFLPKAIVSSLSAGVDKYFWFIMPYYRERDFMLFGLLREDMTPTAGYCALSACTYALGKASYLGKLSIAAVHAYAFNRGNGELAIAFWKDAGEKTFSLSVEAHKAKLVDLMGAEQEIPVSEGVVEVTAMTSVKYLILPSGSLKKAPVKEYIKERDEILPYDSDKVSSIVVRVRFPKESRDKEKETYLLPGALNTKAAVEVYNFGRSDLQCKLRLQLPEGWNGTLDEREINVGPMGREVRDLQLSAKSELGPEPAQIRVSVINSNSKAGAFTLAWIAVRYSDMKGNEK